MTGARYAPAPQKHKTAANGKGVGHPNAVNWTDLWSVASVDARPLLLAFAMVGGVIGYFQLLSEPSLWSVGLALGASIGLLVLLHRMIAPDLFQISAWIAFGLVLGLTAATVRAWRVSAPIIGGETRPVMLEGWLAEIEPGSKGPRLRIDVHAIAGYAPVQTPRVVRLTHMARLEVSPGRFVRCWAVLRPPPAPSMPGEYDFQRQAFFQQLGAVGYVQGRCRGGTLGAPDTIRGKMGLKVAAFRRKLATHVSVAAGEEAGGFAAALISGDRSYMPVADQEALRNSGLAHLLAISGLHMAIVGGLVFLIMRRVLALIEPLALRVAVQKPAAVTALIASLAYLILSGASVSTQRAFIMSSVVFGAVLFDRAALSMRSFAIAMILVVLLQPESVMTPGFQMSYAASGALIATYEAWTARRSARERVMGRFSYSWASLAVTSLVAGTATAPFALYHFDRVAGLGFVANLAAMPVITFVAAPAAALALILTPFGYGDLGLRLFGYSLELVLAIARACSDYAPSVLTPGKQMPGVSLALFSTALAMAILSRGWARGALALAGSIPAIWLWVAAPAMMLHWSPSGDVFIRDVSGQVIRIDYVKGDGLSPMRFSDLAPSDTCTDWPCRIETDSGIVVLSAPEAGPKLCLLAYSGASACGWEVTWSAASHSHGITRYTDGRIEGVEVGAAVCKARPWRACRTAIP